MCQSKSAGTFQGKNAVMYQNKSAGMYPSKNVAMYPSKSVGMYRSKNAAMYQSKSAKMYPNKSAGTYRSKNARTYPSKSARNSASRYCGVKYALDGGTLLFCIFVNASERRKSSMTINEVCNCWRATLFVASLPKASSLQPYCLRGGGDTAPIINCFQHCAHQKATIVIWTNVMITLRSKQSAFSYMMQWWLYHFKHMVNGHMTIHNIVTRAKNMKT